jgi:arylformamidase
MKIFDISQTIRPGIAVWPGDRRFSSRWQMQIEAGDSCNVSSVTMSVHTGTHVDAPYHFDSSGADVAGVSLEQYVGPARVFQLSTTQPIALRDVESLDWNGVERVLFRTGSSEVQEDRFDRAFVPLTPEAAEFLGGRRLRLVGTDAPSVDAFDSKTLESHKILLRHGVAILEGVRLREVPPGDYTLVCLPLKFAGLDGSPVRAILIA